MPRRPESSPATRAVLRGLLEYGTTWCHGYVLARATGLRSGTLYPILTRLADAELLDATWESDPPEGRPRRHLYRLTPAGTALAQALPAEQAVRPRARALRPVTETG